MTTTSGETVLISIAEILDRTNTPMEFTLNGSSDPFYDPMTLPNNPPIPALDFYIHDHLGIRESFTTLLGIVFHDSNRENKMVWFIL